jgi:hypothetical protein
VDSSTTSVSGRYGTEFRTEIILLCVPCVARSGHFATSDKCTRLRVSDRPDSGDCAVSTEIVECPPRPASRRTFDGSPNDRCFRPLSENDRPVIGGLIEKPSPSSSSVGRCECIRSVMLKIAPAAFTS